ncbi:MAG: glycosyltransferase family 9 protein [Phaeodactylibacter sp.]|nr:glycosyltransferase family 9 protein [Phaeodactylibacter sp.]
MQKILIIQTAFIGDVILATALIEKLHAHFPEAQIDFLLRKGNEGLLAGHPYIRQRWIWDKKHGKYKSLFKLIRQIRRERYDVVVNLQRFFSTGLLTALSGARQRLGFDKNPLSFTFTRHLPHAFGTDAEPIHEVERNLSLIAHLTDSTFTKPHLYPPPVLPDQLDTRIPYICLAPTSVWYTKQWPLEKWVGLLDRLPQDHRLFLLGGPTDQGACAVLQAQTQHPMVENLAGKLNLLESARLMQGAVMNYVNDSAPLHLASAVDAPVTAIFCSTVPAFGFYPLSSRSSIVQTTATLDCLPCGLHGKKACPEGHFKCSHIAVEQLLQPLQNKEAL